MKSNATTIQEYLDELSPERREAVSAVREVVLERLPDGFVEAMDFGMIAYVIPLERYPKTYNGHPLLYAAISSEKRYVSVHLMGIYSDGQSESWFVDSYKATGKRLDMGKSCVRFRKLEDLPLELVGEAVSRTSADEYIRLYEESRPPKRASRRRRS